MTKGQNCNPRPEFHVCGHCGDFARLPKRVQCKCRPEYKYFSYPPQQRPETGHPMLCGCKECM